MLAIHMQCSLNDFCRLSASHLRNVRFAIHMPFQRNKREHFRLQSIYKKKRLKKKLQHSSTRSGYCKTSVYVNVKSVRASTFNVDIHMYVAVYKCICEKESFRLHSFLDSVLPSPSPSPSLQWKKKWLPWLYVCMCVLHA